MTDGILLYLEKAAISHAVQFYAAWEFHGLYGVANFI
jgi:hypothetical protein